MLRKLKWLKRDKMKMNKYHVGEAAAEGGRGGGEGSDFSNRPDWLIKQK